MDLLSNEKVLKFFCDCMVHDRGNCEPGMALRILESMQTPIRKGERYLRIDYASMHDPLIGANEASISERIAGNWKSEGQSSEWTKHYQSELEFHPLALRLPDCFQKAECECLRLFHNEYDCKCLCSQCKPAPWKCVMHPNEITCHLCKPADPVEEKIQWLMRRWAGHGDAPSDVTEMLRALVKMVREEK